MLVDKKCEICGKEFKVPHWRIDTAKYCSKECQHNSLKAKPNLVCQICGKYFHRKPFHINRYKGDLGFCCSKSCASKLMKARMSGENNHQYGMKGELNSSYKQGKRFSNNHKNIDILIYIGDWYKKYNESGRITEHRYLVELNHLLYPSEYFEEIDGWYYLKDGLHIHHKDHNHNNNQLSNLEILTRGEHCRIHNLSNPRKRNKKGQFIKCISMELNDYQERAMTTCMDSSRNFSYMFLNLVGEVGEFASKVAKAIRKGNAEILHSKLSRIGDTDMLAKHEEELMKEAGDCLWQLSGLCSVMGWKLDDIAQMNLDKLAARKKAGTIDGSGDGIIRGK